MGDPSKPTLCKHIISPPFQKKNNNPSHAIEVLYDTYFKRIIVNYSNNFVLP